MNRTLIIDYNERVTDSAKEKIEKTLNLLIETGGIKGYEMAEIPQADPVTLAKKGELNQ